MNAIITNIFFVSGKWLSVCNELVLIGATRCGWCDRRRLDDIENVEVTASQQHVISTLARDAKSDYHSSWLIAGSHRSSQPEETSLRLCMYECHAWYTQIDMLHTDPDSMFWVCATEISLRAIESDARQMLIMHMYIVGMPIRRCVHICTWSLSQKDTQTFTLLMCWAIIGMGNRCVPMPTFKWNAKKTHPSTYEITRCNYSTYKFMCVLMIIPIVGQQWAKIINETHI